MLECLLGYDEYAPAPGTPAVMGIDIDNMNLRRQAGTVEIWVCKA